MADLDNILSGGIELSKYNRDPKLAMLLVVCKNAFIKRIATFVRDMSPRPIFICSSWDEAWAEIKLRLEQEDTQA